MKKTCSILAALAALPLLTTTAHAAVFVDFSGGGGTPLSFTVSGLEWDITDAVAFNATPAFGIGIAVGQPAAASLYGFSSIGGDPADWSASGTSDFPSATAHNFYANNNFGSATNGGILWFGMNSNQSATNGETVTFSGGTLGSNLNVTQTFTDGFYDIYLVGGSSGQTVSTAAVAVPEPSALALALGAGLLALRRKR